MTITAITPYRTFTVQDLRAFLALNGRRPIDGKTAPDAERDLARWIDQPQQRISTQVQNALESYPPRRGRPSRTRLPDSITAMYPVPEAPPAEDQPAGAREGRLAELEMHLSTHGRTPRQKSEDRAERSLAKWVATQKARPQPDSRLADLLSTAPGWGRPVRPVGMSADEHEQLKLEELRAFCLEHARMPSRQSGKPDERRMRDWITQQRIETVPGLADLLDEYRTPAELVLQRAYEKRAELQRAAETRTPWPTNPQVMARLEQLRAFIAEHGVVPNRRSADYDEEHLGHWAYRHGRLACPHPEVMELLESGGGYGAMAVMHTTAQRKEQLEAFIARHGRLPMAKAQDDDERALGSWAYHHQSRVNPNPEVLEVIEQAGGYRTLGSTITWSGEYALFCAIHGRRPSITRKDEKRLTTWESRCDDRHEPSSVLGMLVALYPTLQAVKAGANPVAVSANKSVRLRRMRELTAFRAEHERMPVTSADDPVERSLAAWVHDNATGAAAHPAVSALILGAVDVGTADEMPGRRTHQTTQEAPRPIGDTPKVLARIAALESFVEVHGKLPRSTTTDVEERRLGQWAYQQVRVGRAHPRVAEIVEAHGGYRHWRTKG